ncbi:MAG: peptide/nickel transport system substrate-binding protein [Acidimicrobiaceae bacterium]|jgi:peptide/nickel transport system substrate-binding protein
MRPVLKLSRLVCLPLALVLLAAACGSSGSTKNGASGTGTTVAPKDVPTGGTLVLAADQEGDCTDWMGSCGGSSWFFWSIGNLTMPKAYSVQKAGDGWVAKPTTLLTGEAEVTATPKQVVTYHINPQAKWSDGTPITSTDFKFTWEQVAKGNDIYDRTGYEKVESVDDSKPDTAVVTFSDTFADWKTTLFGGNYGVYPAHLMKDHSEIANGYNWSGGPWKLDHWTKGTEWVLVPNPAYWGEKPKLDKVIFKLITDSSAEFQALKAGEVLGGYPQPQVDVIDQISAGGLTDTKAQYSPETGNAEALWMNAGKAPFDDINFRTAIAYAIDRDAIVERLFGKLGVHKALQTVTAPVLAPFASTNAFARYTKNPAKVNEFMTKAGWAKGPDGIWAKNGQPATFEIKTTTGNKRRELTEQVLQQDLKDAGFTVTLNNQKSSDLFGDQLPKGDFQVALYSNVLTSFYPSNCNLLCSKNIPTADNKFSGDNWTRTNVPELDTDYGNVEKNLNQTEAQAANKKGDDALADNVSILPLDPLPNILLTSSKIVGSVADNPIEGPFWQMTGWGLAK